MNDYWVELDYYQDIKVVCSEDATTRTSIFERDIIVEFLAGVNTEHDQIQVRVWILGREKLPSLNEVFSMIRSEEHRRIAMFNEFNPEGSTTVSNQMDGSCSRSQHQGMTRTLDNKAEKVCGVHIAKKQSTLEKHTLSCMEMRFFQVRWEVSGICSPEIKHKPIS